MVMNLEQAMKRFGRNVQNIRKTRKITQEKMRDFGFNYRYFQKIEAGLVNPTLGTLLKLSKTFNCEISELLNF